MGQDNNEILSNVLKDNLSLILKERMKQILVYAQMSLSESQYMAFRKLILDLFGVRGLERDIQKIVDKVLERAGAGKCE